MAKVKQTRDGGPNFLVRHVEKLVLLVVVGLVFVFVYLGYSQKGLEPGNTPDKLIQNAKSAKEHVLDPKNWDNIATSITISTGQKEQVAKSQIATNAQLYAWDKPLEPINVQSGKKRMDPAIFAPEKVETLVVSGPVAYWKQPTEEDLLALETNSAYEVKKVSKKKRRQLGEYGYSEDPAGMSEATAGMSGMMSGAMMSGGMMPGGMMSGGMMGDGSMMGAMGYGGEMGMGMAGGIMANPMDRKGFRAGMGAIAKSRNCVVVRAVVPWKKQWDEYVAKLSTALGYSPMRDVPKYVAFKALRAEVTADPNAPLKWEDHAFHTLEFQRQLQINEMKYYQYPPEWADPRYVYPYVFTMPVPPFIEREIAQLATHSLVPKIKPNFMMRPLTKEQKEALQKRIEEMKTKKKSDDPGVQGIAGMQAMPGVVGLPGLGGGMGYGAESMGMPGMSMPGMSMPGMGMPGMSMPGMGMPGMGMPGMGMPGDSAYGGSEGGMGMAGMGMPGMGMPGMGMPGMGMPGDAGMSGYGGYSGYGSEMGMMGGPLTPGPQVDYLLIRFFDFGVEPGKRYRYRIQLMIEDPNHPAMAALSPLDRFLDDTVKKRLMTVAAAEQEKKKGLTDRPLMEQQLRSRIYYLRSEFSEPSDIVTIQVPPTTIAGAISGAKFQPLAKESGAPPDLLVQTDEPSGKMMSVIYDPDKTVDVPGVIDVYRGTVLNFKSNSDVIHPVMLVFKKLPDITFRTERMVADIRGGMELEQEVPKAAQTAAAAAQTAMMTGAGYGAEGYQPTAPAKPDPLYTLGEYAIVDEHGKLNIYSEFDDYDNFRKLVLPPQPETMGAYGGMPGDSVGIGGGAMPGDEGGGRRKRSRE